MAGVQTLQSNTPWHVSIPLQRIHPVSREVRLPGYTVDSTPENTSTVVSREVRLPGYIVDSDSWTAFHVFFFSLKITFGDVSFLSVFYFWFLTIVLLVLWFIIYNLIYLCRLTPQNAAGSTDFNVGEDWWVWFNSSVCSINHHPVDEHSQSL